MNDRFKFRFYDKENKIMVYADTDDELLPYYPDEIYTTWQTYDLSAIEHLANDEDYIVMQCTGLKDKNGKLIYEGDILIQKEENGGPTKKLVIWEEEGGYLGLKDLKKSFLGVVTFHLFGYTYEVIGNIHENPELLEVSNEH